MNKTAKEDLSRLLKTPSADKWEIIGLHKRAGVLAPLFSLYSKNSLGIGDLDDLKLLIDWCAKTGNSILELLPMNEVGSTFCPYDAISSFALEPAYIHLPDSVVTNKLKKEYAAGKGHVNYRVKEAKIRILRNIYAGKSNTETRGFEEFLEKNNYWIYDFTLFKVLKDYNSGKPWYEWEEGYRNRDPGLLELFQKDHASEIAFQKWVQFIAYNQFRKAKAYAESKNILVKGDLPILISRDSADVWAHPEFFKLEYAAGAPPDAYCAKGQRWGMPTYDWDAIASEDYDYIREKLKYAENFYDILRVDHVVGLFRIWSIPYNEPAENAGLNGFFDPKDENVWEEHGKSILSVMLGSTKMLLCAEDLGIIPKVCPDTIKKFGIPGNDVERWMKDWKVKHDFLEPDKYRPLSIAILSTHDTTNWAAWWENEAGTIDEELFKRKCLDRGIDYEYVKGRLFDSHKSRHGRLRWLGTVESENILIEILGKRKEEMKDFITLYEDTFNEKNKLWKHLSLKGPMREKANPEIIESVLRITLESRSIFCINLMIDWLMLTNIFKGDPYQYRINTPGTISDKNWSLTIPISLEDLLKHDICKDIRKMIKSSERLCK